MMALHLCSVAALVARYAGNGAGAKKCEFAAGRDYADPAGPVFNATSAAVCCQQCFATPQCIVAVFAPSHSQAPPRKPAPHPGPALPSPPRLPLLLGTRGVDAKVEGSRRGR